MSFSCALCSRPFDSGEALQQHKRDSIAHEFDCTACSRHFGSGTALTQHLRDSPVHAQSFECEICDRTFGNGEALVQHLRDSPVHAFPETPLDIFFRSFPTFDYNPSLPPTTSYANLRRHKGWRRSNAASKDAWNRYQDALESELRMWYGAENDLTAWHALCRAIGVEPLPQTCAQCQEAVRRTHVNIVDLIEWGRRRGNSEEKVQTFRNVQQLRAYTKETGKGTSAFTFASTITLVAHSLALLFQPGYVHSTLYGEDAKVSSSLLLFFRFVGIPILILAIITPIFAPKRTADHATAMLTTVTLHHLCVSLFLANEAGSLLGGIIRVWGGVLAGWGILVVVFGGEGEYHAQKHREGFPFPNEHDRRGEKRGPFEKAKARAKGERKKK
ncbi:hypothetical protein BDY21DRAFT_376649 [Lineolata rhizophorae]|uniref:C2H2-type domain-containing protein n=1 Tax=Lineolata rhizophorae TaxID=578093 RepID=A0A6A6PA17_9PEZI|nr:hypothetical protein BDY21DRAFT_376649 [Lineolata rhizophorae]